MAHRLKMATVSALLILKQRGWSNRRIAKELGIRRETVARYLALEAQAQAVRVPGGSAGPPGVPAAAAEGDFPAVDSKPATAPLGLPAPKPDTAPLGSGSRCAPYRGVILAKLELGLSAQRIYQDLVSEQGYGGSYYSVRRFVRRHNRSSELPFRRLECAPGQEGQIDFGRAAPVIGGDGRLRRGHALRVVLSCSRKGYSETIERQTTDDFLLCLENAFHHFGGVPRTIVIDNLKAAVTKADWFDPELNPKIISFCEHYGTVILPTKPYTPRHKGKVERGVDYVQENALKGKSFDSFAAENAYLLEWETRVADTRVHGTTHRQVGAYFKEVEQPALLPLPATRFANFQEGRRSVHRDGHVEVSQAYYSVPPEYLGRTVWVRWDGRLVRIFNQRMEAIAVHAQAEPGRFATRSEHIHPHKIANMERGTVYLLQRARLIGSQTAQWSEAMLQARGLPGIRVLVGLLSLASHHPHQELERACGIALSHSAFRLHTIRELIQRDGGRQEEFGFMERHPIIRNLSDYQALVQGALR